nr:hypothetical protein [Candidatus Sigynarchaeota archaeon]
MEIDKEFRKETVWKIKLSETKMLVLTAIEDTIQPEPTVTFTIVDAEKNSRMSVDLTKDKFLNMSEVFDSFSQVCLGVEPTFTEEMLGPVAHPAPKTEPKPEPMPEPKPEPKPEPTPEPKSEPKPEPKPEPLPEPRHEPKPEPATARPDPSPARKLDPVQKPAPPVLPTPPVTRAINVPAAEPALVSAPSPASSVRWPPRFPKVEEENLDDLADASPQVLDEFDDVPVVIPAKEEPKKEPVKEFKAPRVEASGPKDEDTTAEWDPW